MRPLEAWALSLCGGLAREEGGCGDLAVGRFLGPPTSGSLCLRLKGEATLRTKP